PEAKVRARAGAIGFPGETAETAVAHLSGGEKSRLLMGLACFDAPHLVVLDEPTNHLDVDSRAALVEAINGFAGAVILVSHDRYLLEACADRLWLVANGTVTPFDGDLDDYRALVLSRARDDGEEDAAKPDAGRSRSEARRAAAEKRAELAPLKRRITALEAEMGKVGKRIGEIDQVLADPALYERDPTRVTMLAKERADASAALAAAEEQGPARRGESEGAGGCLPARSGERGAEHRRRVLAERLARGVAIVEHVTARIDRELQPIGRAVDRQLIEQQLAAEIRRDQIVRAVHDQHAHLRIAGEIVAQVVHHFPADSGATPV